MSGKWEVDWEDYFYPKIIPISEAQKGQEGMTFREAKREIVRKCHEEIEHWRIIAQQAKKLRASTIN